MLNVPDTFADLTLSPTFHKATASFNVAEVDRFAFLFMRLNLEYILKCSFAISCVTIVFAGAGTSLYAETYEPEKRLQALDGLVVSYHLLIEKIDLLAGDPAAQEERRLNDDAVAAAENIAVAGDWVYSWEEEIEGTLAISDGDLYVSVLPVVSDAGDPHGPTRPQHLDIHLRPNSDLLPLARLAITKLGDGSAAHLLFAGADHLRQRQATFSPLLLVSLGLGPFGNTEYATSWLRDPRSGRITLSEVNGLNFESAGRGSVSSQKWLFGDSGTLPQVRLVEGRVSFDGRTEGILHRIDIRHGKEENDQLKIVPSEAVQRTYSTVSDGSRKPLLGYRKTLRLMDARIDRALSASLTDPVIPEGTIVSVINTNERPKGLTTDEKLDKVWEAIQNEK